MILVDGHPLYAPAFERDLSVLPKIELLADIDVAGR